MRANPKAKSVEKPDLTPSFAGPTVGRPSLLQERVKHPPRSRNANAGICRTRLRPSRGGRCLFLLAWGEGQDEGEPQRNWSCAPHCICRDLPLDDFRGLAIMLE